MTRKLYTCEILEVCYAQNRYKKLVLGAAKVRSADVNTILSNITDDANVCWGRGADSPSDSPFYAAGVCMVKKTQYGCIQVAFKSAGEFDGFYINQRWMSSWSGWKKSITTNV